MNRVYLAVMVVALVFGTVFVTASVAHAQEEPELIDVAITVFHGDPGEIVVVGVIQADPGVVCTVTLGFVNEPDSLHPDNNVMVGPLIYHDVESGNPILNPTRRFETSGDIVIAIELGPDGKLSGGLRLTGPCGLPPPPPDETTTTTTEPPAPAPTTTTTEPAPINGVDTGGGAMAAQVSGQDPVILLALGAVLLTVGFLMAAWVIGWRLWNLWARRNVRHSAQR